MVDYYTMKDVCDAVGVSASAVRNYADRYARYLSTEATPPPGQPRRFTEADVKLIAYVRHQTESNLNHDAVMQLLASDDLDNFDWSMPEDAPHTATVQTEEATAPLVPYASLLAMQRIHESTEQRLTATEHELAQARARIEALQHDLGRLEGENAQLSKPWWKRIIGLE